MLSVVDHPIAKHYSIGVGWYCSQFRKVYEVKWRGIWCPIRVSILGSPIIFICTSPWDNVHRLRKTSVALCHRVAGALVVAEQWIVDA
jgi:hypothetical protein